MGKEKPGTNSALMTQSSVLACRSSILITHHSLSELLTAVLTKGLHCCFIATGHSMSPFIKDGDEITVSPLHDSSPCLGAVVALIHPENGRLAIHRVVGKKGDSYLIKGDNSSDFDGFVQKENILGFVTKVEREGKNISIGLGPERFLIAFLTRRGLFPLLLSVWRLIRPFVRLR